jgi:sugar diacid utilization regulator
MKQDDWAEEYADLIKVHAELVCEHGEVLKDHLELSRDHNDLLRKTIAMTQRATELENLIEEHGLCPAPLNTPKVPESFEEWERQQQKGGEG